MLRKIYKFIEENILQNDALYAFGGAIFLIIYFCIFMFGLVDSTPATQNDYAPLIQQQEEIANNFNTIYSYDNYKIEPIQNDVEVTLSNKECELICKFDKNLKYLSSKKSDLYIPKIGAVLISILMGLMCAYVSAMLLFVFIPFLIILLLKLLEKICRLLT